MCEIPLLHLLQTAAYLSPISHRAPLVGALNEEV